MRPISYTIVGAIVALALLTLNFVAAAPVGTQATRDPLLSAQDIKGINTVPGQDSTQEPNPCKVAGTSLEGASSPCSPKPSLPTPETQWTGPTFPCPKRWPLYGGIGPACRPNPKSSPVPAPTPSPSPCPPSA